MRIDPEFLKTHEISTLELVPGLARVGVEICITGNDSGSSFSISKGVISRLDAIGSSGYFNTSYIQAATGVKSGSSGSPVITVDGSVVGIMSCGTTLANIDEFVPVDRPLHVLKCLSQNRPVMRGSVQAEWRLRSFEECRRMGLTDEWKDKVREQFPDHSSMLVTGWVLPEGPADGKIATGDILLKVNGKLVTLFLPLNEALDASVGKSLDLLVLRNGQELSATIDVQDFASILPTQIFKFNGVYFHNLSYKSAMDHCVPLKGVYYSGGYYSLTNLGDIGIIDSIDNVSTPDLETFMKVIKSKPGKTACPNVFENAHI